MLLTLAPFLPTVDPLQRSPWPLRMLREARGAPKTGPVVDCVFTSMT